MKYVPDMSRHFRYGIDKTLRDVNKKKLLISYNYNKIIAHLLI